MAQARGAWMFQALRLHLLGRDGFVHAGIPPDNDGERQPNEHRVRDETVDDSQSGNRQFRRCGEGQYETADDVDCGPVDHCAQKDGAAQESDPAGSQNEDSRDHEGKYEMNEQPQERGRVATGKCSQP